MTRFARFVLWFVSAYTIVILLHESAHAIVAHGLGLTAVLHHFWVDIDNQSTLAQRAAFGVAGPVASLVVGVVAWWSYRRVRAGASGSALAMPLAYLAAMGISNFFGNLMSTAFIGDFSNVARWTGMPMATRYTASVIGALMVALVLFMAGRELRSLLPARMSRLTAAGTAVLLPAALGTALIILINEPTAIAGFEAARMGEGAFWIFGAAGTFWAKPPSGIEATPDRLRWQDVACALIVVVAVRLLVPGVALQR